MEKSGDSDTTGGNVNGAVALEKQSWQFLKSLSTELTMCVCACMCYWLLSHVRLFATPWTIAHQAPLSMGFSRQE